MARVYQVDALVRQRPGISLAELRAALGTDVHRPLKRLELVGYIERVQSDDKVVFYPVEQPADMTVFPAKCARPPPQYLPSPFDHLDTDVPQPQAWCRWRLMERWMPNFSWNGAELPERRSDEPRRSAPWLAVVGILALLCLFVLLIAGKL